MKSQATTKPITEFTRNAEKHWPRIAAKLRGQGVVTVTAYEHARAQLMGMHFDADQARIFNTAYSEVQLEVLHEKSEPKKARA